MSVFGPFRPIFGQETDPKLSGSIFFAKRIHQKKIQLKIPIFSKSDDDTTWWPNSYKNILTCGQLRNIQRYQKYVQLVRAFFLELRTYSGQQWIRLEGLNGPNFRCFWIIVQFWNKIWSIICHLFFLYFCNILFRKMRSFEKFIFWQNLLQNP